MMRALIKSTLFGLVLAGKASAMAPAVSCSPELCPWNFTTEVNTDLPREQPNLVLQRFPSDGIENHMPVGRTDESGIPSTVEGIWWMNFNQPGDILVTFGTARWDSETRTAEVPVYGERTYSFHATETAAKSYAPLLKSRYTYYVQFNEDYTKATITPSLVVFGRQVRVPKAVARFTMELKSDGHWVRQTWVLGRRLPDYDLLRVVGPDLIRDAAYEDYLKVAEEESYLAVPAGE
ncbi:MAG: hypothetical protein FJ146_14380 [Deltaproteobacteria bacterium]|nr:hypothetical protein [Deltaproteobacteria bacterium]